MDINKMLGDLQYTRLYYDNSLDNCQTVGHIIVKSVRVRYQWSQKQLADLLSCTDSYICKIERKHFVASAAILLRLADIIEEMEDIDNDFKE